MSGRTTAPRRPRWLIFQPHQERPPVPNRPPSAFHRQRQRDGSTEPAVTVHRDLILGACMRREINAALQPAAGIIIGRDPRQRVDSGPGIYSQDRVETAAVRRHGGSNV